MYQIIVYLLQYLRLTDDIYHSNNTVASSRQPSFLTLRVKITDRPVQRNSMHTQKPQQQWRYDALCSYRRVVQNNPTVTIYTSLFTVHQVSSVYILSMDHGVLFIEHRVHTYQSVLKYEGRFEQILLKKLVLIVWYRVVYNNSRSSRFPKSLAATNTLAREREPYVP